MRYPALVALAIVPSWFIASARAAEPTFIKPAWEVKLPPYGFFDDDDRERYGKAFAWVKDKIDTARKEMLKANRPIIPPNEPLVDEKLVCVQTPLGLLTYSMHADPNVMPPVKPGELYWTANQWDGLIEFGQKGGTRAVIDQMFAGENLSAFNEQIFGYSLAGRISRNSKLTFYVADYGILPSDPKFKNPKLRLNFFDHLFEKNSVMAMETENGKLRLRFDSNHSIEKRPTPAFFLGAPLAVGELLYVLLERDAELRLVHIDPASTKGRGEFFDGIQHDTSIMKAPESAQTDFPRRIHALIPIATGKLIICPTHLGAVVAVNRDDHKVAWAFRYGKPEDKRFENFSYSWRVRPMLVAGDLVVYAPADADALYAFKLSDGKEAWKIERGKGVYLAGLHDRKAIVVDSNAIRAVNAADGKEVWKVPFEGTLTGYGAFHGDRFYQPLGLGKNADEGILRVIDLKQGKIAGTIQRADKKEFGNLLIHKGKLISQTFESLSVFTMP